MVELMHDGQVGPLVEGDRDGAGPQGAHQGVDLDQFEVLRHGNLVVVLQFVDEFGPRDSVVGTQKDHLRVDGIAWDPSTGVGGGECKLFGPDGHLEGVVGLHGDGRVEADEGLPFTHELHGPIRGTIIVHVGDDLQVGDAARVSEVHRGGIRIDRPPQEEILARSPVQTGDLSIHKFVVVPAGAVLCSALDFASAGRSVALGVGGEGGRGQHVEVPVVPTVVGVPEGDGRGVHEHVAALQTVPHGEGADGLLHLVDHAEVDVAGHEIAFGDGVLEGDEPQPTDGRADLHVDQSSLEGRRGGGPRGVARLLPRRRERVCGADGPPVGGEHALHVVVDVQVAPGGPQEGGPVAPEGPTVPHSEIGLRHITVGCQLVARSSTSVLSAVYPRHTPHARIQGSFTVGCRCLLLLNASQVEDGG
mmetsp:Transcript_163/g.429  ORF Transcript_163/g.429 Transcript_163/m.429 type:complete len:418 (+) Transcript_163:1172-2425(+)